MGWREKWEMHVCPKWGSSKDEAMRISRSEATCGTGTVQALPGQGKEELPTIMSIAQ